MIVNFRKKKLLITLSLIGFILVVLMIANGDKNNIRNDENGQEDEVSETQKSEEKNIPNTGSLDTFKDSFNDNFNNINDLSNDLGEFYDDFEATQ